MAETAGLHEIDESGLLHGMGNYPALNARASFFGGLGTVACILESDLRGGDVPSVS